MDKHLVILLKFSEKKWIDKTIESNSIYMNTLKYYRDIEFKTLNKSIGDRFEANKNRALATYINFPNHNCDTNYVEFDYIIDGNQCVYCLYALTLNEFTKHDGYYECEVPFSTINEFVDFKNENKVLIYTNPMRFIEELDISLKREGYNGAFGMVKYDGHFYKPLVSTRSNKKESYKITPDCNTFKNCNITKEEKLHSFEVSFHKRTEYEYQNEFRLVVLNSEDKPIEKLSVDFRKIQYSEITLEQNKGLKVKFEIEHLKKIGRNLVAEVGEMFFEQI